MIEKLEPAGKSVFEVGLGYGSVSQLLAQLGGNVTCLDIAEGPVAMANHRFNHLGLPGVAQVGDILAEPVEHEVYDVVVSIGALHHTGNLAKSISNIKKMLRLGGKGLIMVYNAYSFRRWQSTPGETMNYLRREIMGYRGVIGGNERSAVQRSKYDTNSQGEPAPYTDWVSKKSLVNLLGDAEKLDVVRKNFDDSSRLQRSRILNTAVERYLGLDLYASFDKLP